MNEKKRKEIEAKLLQLFTQTRPDAKYDDRNPGNAPVIKVIRRRKGKPDMKVA